MGLAAKPEDDALPVPPRRREMMTKDGLVLRFKHETGAWPQTLKRKVRDTVTRQWFTEKYEVLAQRRTVCEIISGPKGNETLVATAAAYLSPSDTYNKEVGRQVALHEALKRLPKGSQAGRELKAQYLRRTGATPWLLDRDGHLTSDSVQRAVQRAVDQGLVREWSHGS